MWGKGAPTYKGRTIEVPEAVCYPRPLQEKVKALVDLAREHGATTIAERVEDANTMAVLWQLGIEFIQGYFVNSPERVVM